MTAIKTKKILELTWKKYVSQQNLGWSNLT